MSGAHYFSPPARAYPLNRCLYLLKSDPDFCLRYRADMAAAIEGLGLDDEMKSALMVFDPERLVALGAHPYLVFMAGLRLKMEHQPGAFEYF